MLADVCLAAPVFVDAYAAARVLVGFLPAVLLTFLVIFAVRTGRFPDAAVVGWTAPAGSVIGTVVGLVVRWEDPDWRSGAPFCLGLLGGLGGSFVGMLIYSLVSRNKDYRRGVAGFVQFLLFGGLVSLGLIYLEGRKEPAAVQSSPGPSVLKLKPGGR